MIMNTLSLLILCLVIPFFGTCFSYTSKSCGENFTCGDVNVGFPFWGGSSRPKECGYPELELTCEDVIQPAIEIAKMKFYVKGINQESKVLTIARGDLTDGLCLHTFVNTTLDYKRFYNAQGTQNITILYGCPSPEDGGYTVEGGGGSSGGGYRATFYCRISGVPDTYTNSYIQPGVTGPIGCGTSVVVPVSASSNTQLQQSNSTVVLTQAVQDGFDVNYKIQGQDIALCAQCAASKGRCVIDHGATTCVCPDGSSAYTSCGIKSPGTGHRKLNIALSACFVVTGMCMLIGLLLYLKKRFSSVDQGVKVFEEESMVDVESFLRSQGSLGPKRYTYSDLKKIANSFSDKLGAGGYGSVYRGQLQNGNQVAVKLLHKTKGRTEEFINEFVSSGSTNHVNVVKLLGFCYEGHRRALVYEFMANGSLEKFLYKGNNRQSLGLETLFKIAIGVARGLEYLHRGCNTRILHFDIKPHNILLDENFSPKISDFGLAKSCAQRDSTLLSMSEARGTVGYIAPEVFFRSYGGVSYKSDVYSYGMLVLEMVGCRLKANIEGELSSEQYFPAWVYNQLEAGKEHNQDGALSSEDIELQRKMIIVSLCCVQTNPSNRPAMSKVVEMLEGTLELQAPPPSSLSTSTSTSASLSASLRSQNSIHTT